MNCPDEKTLIALLDGDLSGDREKRIRAHLDSCSDCSTEHARYGELMDTLHQQESVEVDHAFVQRVTNEVEYIDALEEEPTTDRETSSGFRPFLRRNASWVASLSLHFSLVFLVAFLVVSEFSANEPTFSGIPVMKNQPANRSLDWIRSSALWRGQFRRMRTSTREASGSECDLEQRRRDHVKRAHRTLLARQNENGTWPRRSSGPEETIQTTSLAVLALLRSRDLTSIKPRMLDKRLRSGLTALVDMQVESGRIGPAHLPPSAHAVATAALLESSLLNGRPEHTRQALKALHHLLDRTSTNEELFSAGHWTLISFRLGAAFGSRTARRRLMERNGTTASPSSETLHSILARGLLSEGPLPERDQTRLIRRIRQWKQANTNDRNPTSIPVSVMNEPDPLHLSSAAFFARGDADRVWTKTLDRLLPPEQPLDTESLTSPALARYILTFRTCRSYPR